MEKSKNDKVYQEEEAFLKLLRQGKSRKEACEAIGREKTWASRTIKKIRETEPERLKGTAEEIKNEVFAEQLEEKILAQDASQVEKKPETATKPQEPIESVPMEEKAEEKRVMRVTGFRADVDKINLWRIYAESVGQEIGVMYATAIDEYIKNHKLTADQQTIYDLKKKILEVERKMKEQS